MPLPRLTRLEHRVMDVLWHRGASSVRDIHSALPHHGRMPAYTTVQTIVYRLEAKGIVRRTGRIRNAHVFEATVAREAAQRRLIDELLAFFEGQVQPVVMHLVESGRLTQADVRDAERALRKLQRKGERK